MLDSNICIYLLNEKSPDLLEKFYRHRGEGIYTSSIVVAELEFGIAKSAYPEKNAASLHKLSSVITVLDFDSCAAKCYGTIRADLQQRGELIGPLDMLIAAHAQSADLTLVTNNTREFGRIEQLTIENWT